MLSKNTVVVSIHPFFTYARKVALYLYKRWGKTEIAEATEAIEATEVTKVIEVVEAIEANQALRLLRPHL